MMDMAGSGTALEDEGLGVISEKLGRIFHE